MHKVGHQKQNTGGHHNKQKASYHDAHNDTINHYLDKILSLTQENTHGTDISAPINKEKMWLEISQIQAPASTM